MFFGRRAHNIRNIECRQFMLGSLPIVWLFQCIFYLTSKSDFRLDSSENGREFFWRLLHFPPILKKFIANPGNKKEISQKNPKSSSNFKTISLWKYFLTMPLTLKVGPSMDPWTIGLLDSICCVWSQFASYTWAQFFRMRWLVFPSNTDNHPI